MKTFIKNLFFFLLFISVVLGLVLFIIVIDEKQVELRFQKSHPNIQKSTPFYPDYIDPCEAKELAE